MMGGFGIVGLLVPILLVVLAVWAIARMFPDWQERVNPQRREDTAEETLSPSVDGRWRTLVAWVGTWRGDW